MQSLSTMKKLFPGCLWVIQALFLAACSSDGSNTGSDYEALQKQLERPPEIPASPGQYQGDTDVAAGMPASQPEEKPDNPAVHFQQLDDKVTLISIDEPYARSWSMLVTALREEMFTVKDKDREKGIFYVTFEPGNDSGRKSGNDGGASFWEKLGNLLSYEDDAEGEYRVKLQQQGSHTEVTAEMLVDDVWDDDDNYIDVKANAKKMLAALYKVLRTLPAGH